MPVELLSVDKGREHSVGDGGKSLMVPRRLTLGVGVCVSEGGSGGRRAIPSIIFITTLVKP